MSDSEWFGEVVKFIMIIWKLRVASRYRHFWSQFLTDFDVIQFEALEFPLQGWLQET